MALQNGPSALPNVAFVRLVACGRGGQTADLGVVLLIDPDQVSPAARDPALQLKPTPGASASGCPIIRHFSTFKKSSPSSYGGERLSFCQPGDLSPIPFPVRRSCPRSTDSPPPSPEPGDPLGVREPERLEQFGKYALLPAGKPAIAITRSARPLKPFFFVTPLNLSFHMQRRRLVG